MAPEIILPKEYGELGNTPKWQIEKQGQNMAMSGDGMSIFSSLKQNSILAVSVVGDRQWVSTGISNHAH